MAQDPRPPLSVPPSSVFPIQQAAWSRVRRQWDQRGAPWLHAEVARRMSERLPLIRQAPECIVDWEPQGGGTVWEAQRFPPQATLHPAPGTPSGQTPTGWWGRLRQKWRGSDGRLPIEPSLPPGQADLVWSNMGLHTSADPEAVMAQWLGALKVEGFLMFSTFGPDTLRELSEVWRIRGWGPAAQPFVDMHDWGDALVQAGFADPVMDQETIRLSWANPEAAVQELRTLGRNAHRDRFAGCRTPAWRARMQQALSDLAGPDGRVSLSFEVIYGHAFKPQPRPAVAATTTVSLEDMRAMVQSTRGRN